MTDRANKVRVSESDLVWVYELLHERGMMWAYLGSVISPQENETAADIKGRLQHIRWLDEYLGKTNIPKDDVTRYKAYLPKMVDVLEMDI